ncbi:hypothetical protein A9J41_08075 [Laribacter hongkongensis]|nr:hypothetical protein [Laribacter hongkongensis]
MPNCVASKETRLLTILRPDLLPLVQRIPAGLRVLEGGDESHRLIVKGSKEAILAAKIARRLAVYLVPVHVDGARTISLITAFFDDQDEPIILRSPLFANDPHSASLVRFLHLAEGHVHFFDEHSREMLAYTCRVTAPASTRAFLSAATFVEYRDGAWRGIDDQAMRWFSERTAADDQAVINIELVDTLMPEDVVYIDGTSDTTSYLGAGAVSTTFLIRPEPGALQEHDIALLLQRIFEPELIIKGPLRTTDKEEIADLLVITQDTLIIIQAKDSPNTEAILGNSLSRKRATTLKNLKKAVAQLRGAIRYVSSKPVLSMIVAGREVEVDVSRKRWRGLAVVKELFNDEFATYSPLVLQLARESKVPCVPLDYIELNMYTANLLDEEQFLRAIDQVFGHGDQTGMFPRLRIGLGDWQG